MVILHTDRGVGTGFVALMNTNKYVFTALHVIEGARKLKIETIKGEKLQPVKIEIADNADIARMLVNNQGIEALDIEKRAPRIGEDVGVYGNSQGEGLVTELKGKVLGIGPERMEVSAKFVAGNSGSPILSSDRKAFGVASYVTMTASPTWVERNTRFEQVRRYGYMLPDEKDWAKISPRELWMYGAHIDDVNTYIADLNSIIYVLKELCRNGLNNKSPTRVKKFLGFIEEKCGSRQQQLKIIGSGSLYNFEGFRQKMSSFYDSYFAYIKTRARFSQNSMKSRTNWGRAHKSLRDLASFPREFFEKQKWKSKYHKNRAEEFIKMFEEWEVSLGEDPINDW